jgi:hypothetical protein
MQVLPHDWCTPSIDASVHRHFDAALPEEWECLFTRCFEEVRAILGGAYPCHVICTHTHRWAPGTSAHAVLGALNGLLGDSGPLQVGDYCTFQAMPDARILVLQYDTICAAHRRSVIAHEYMHVHQLSLQRERACGPAHDELPMWLMEGTAALFEHLYINEYWSCLERDGVSAAVRYTQAEAAAGRLTFDAGKETYNDPSMNYYVETCGVLLSRPSPAQPTIPHPIQSLAVPSHPTKSLPVPSPYDHIPTMAVALCSSWHTSAACSLASRSVISRGAVKVASNQQLAASSQQPAAGSQQSVGGRRWAVGGRRYAVGGRS